MSADFSILGSCPESDYFDDPQLDAATVEDDFVLDCFTGTVTFRLGGEDAILLDEAPIVGLCSNLTFALRQIRTSPTVSISDVGGTFCLKLRERSGVVSCEEVYSHDRVDVPSESFIKATKRWVDEMISTMEARFPRLHLNPFYRELSKGLEEDWRDLLPFDADARHSPTAAWRFMTTTLSLKGEAVRVLEGTNDPVDVSELPLADLLTGFYGKVVMVVDEKPTIVLNDVPLLHLIGLLPRSLRRAQGSTCAILKDEAGRLWLDLQDLAGVLTCTDRLSGRKVTVLSAMFRHEVRTWSASMLATLEERFPTLVQNSIYQDVKAQIAADWAKLIPSSDVPSGL